MERGWRKKSIRLLGKPDGVIDRFIGMPRQGLVFIKTVDPSNGMKKTVLIGFFTDLGEKTQS